MNEKIVRDVIKTRNVLRKKFNSIKMHESDAENLLEHTFNPITKPLKELVESSKVSYDDNGTNKFLKLSTSTPLKNSSVNHKFKIEEDTSTDDDTFAMSTADRSKEDTFYSQLDDTDKSSKYTIFDLTKLERNKKLDNLYGPHRDSSDKWRFGNNEFMLRANKISIDDQNWSLTPGLFELLFYKTPKNYNSSDLQIYKEILILTNAHKRNYFENEQIKGTKAFKYRNIIKKLFKDKTLPTSHKGSGLMIVNPLKPNYIYWDDPNEIVDRLRLLISSESAGHTNHNNEIVSIIEELKESNIIV